MTRKLENNEHHEVNKYVVLGLVCKLWGLSLCYSTAAVGFVIWVTDHLAMMNAVVLDSVLSIRMNSFALISLAHSIVLSAWPHDRVYKEGTF